MQFFVANIQVRVQSLRFILNHFIFTVDMSSSFLHHCFLLHFHAAESRKQMRKVIPTRALWLLILINGLLSFGFISNMANHCGSFWRKGEAIKVLAVGNLFALLTSFGAMKGNMHITLGLIKTYATPPKNPGK